MKIRLYTSGLIIIFWVSMIPMVACGMLSKPKSSSAQTDIVPSFTYTPYPTGITSLASTQFITNTPHPTYTPDFTHTPNPAYTPYPTIPGRTSVLILDIPLNVFFPSNYHLTKREELHLRGAFLSYDFDRKDEPKHSISTPFPSAPYFAMIYFFSEDSIAHYVDYCATTDTDGGESFCNLGNFPDLKTYYGQRESFQELSDYENYKLEKIGDRYYFTSPYFGRRGSYTKTKEYTTFVGDIKIDIWISLTSYMEYQPEEVLQLRSAQSDQLFRSFYIDTIHQ